LQKRQGTEKKTEGYPVDAREPIQRARFWLSFFLETRL